MIEYKGKSYEAVPERSEFSCEGCAFIHIIMKMKNVGKLSKPEYKEVDTGQRGCSAPNQEPFRSCKHDHVVFQQITKV